MSITSIYIDAELQVIQGMKNISDFLSLNWFRGLPDIGATPFAGYYFGTPATDISLNSYDNSKPLSFVGTVTNEGGVINVGRDNYAVTDYKSPTDMTIATVIKKGGTRGANTYFISDLSGTGTSVIGFGLAISTSGNIVLAVQNSGQTGPTYANANFYSEAVVGELVGVVATVKNGSLYVATYDPTTQTMTSGTASPPGTYSAGVNNIRIGCKVDNNTSGLTTEVKSALLMAGELTTSEQVSVMQFLLAMY